MSGTEKNNQDWLAQAREVLNVEIEGLAAVRDALDDSFVEALSLMASCEGRVVITGIGKSGLVGRKIAATLSSTGTPAFFLHPVEGAHGDMGMIRREDVVLAISNSGETDELNTLLPSLRALGVKIIAMTGESGSTLAGLSDVALNCRVPREACPMGLAPTASTTAALGLGDALAVCLITWKSFDECDFRRFHPGGSLGQRLSQDIGSLMHRENLPLVTQGISIQEALQILNAGGVGTVIALDQAGCLAGILTDGDLRRLICGGGFDVTRPLSEVMTKRPKSARPEMRAAEVLDIMEAGAIMVLPIVDETNKPIGLVHLHDLLGKGRLKFSEGQIEARIP